MPRPLEHRSLRSARAQTASVFARYRIIEEAETAKALTKADE